MKTPDSQSDSARTPSPCVRNCCLDESDVCIGCGRRMDEILAWHQASNIERDEILSLSRQRLTLRIKHHTSQGP